MRPTSIAASETPVATARDPYEYRLDQSYWDYIKRVSAFFPTDAVRLPLAEQRALYDAMCRNFHPGRPVGVETDDTCIELGRRRVAIRAYASRDRSPEATVLFFHGGGFVFGSLDSHDDTCADLCAETGFNVVSVDYRLAPEHLHPASFEDAITAFGWVTETTLLPIVLVGESAGGNFCCCRRACHPRRQDHGRRPTADLSDLGGEPGPSHEEHAAAPLLTADELASYRMLRTGNAPPAHDPTFEPLNDTCSSDFLRL